MGIKDRLKQYLSYRGLGEGKFEQLVGVSNGYVTKIGKSIGSDKQLLIRKACPDLNIDWLLTGEGEMLLSDTKEPAPSNDKSHDNNFKDKIIELQESLLKEREARIKDKEEIIALQRKLINKSGSSDQAIVDDNLEEQLTKKPTT